MSENGSGFLGRLFGGGSEVQGSATTGHAIVDLGAEQIHVQLTRGESIQVNAMIEAGACPAEAAQHVVEGRR